MNALGNGYDPDGEFYDPDDNLLDRENRTFGYELDDEEEMQKKDPFRNSLRNYSFTPKPRYTAGMDLYQMLMSMIGGQ